MHALPVRYVTAALAADAYATPIPTASAIATTATFAASAAVCVAASAAVSAAAPAAAACAAASAAIAVVCLDRKPICAHLLIGSCCTCICPPPCPAPDKAAASTDGTGSLVKVMMRQCVWGGALVRTTGWAWEAGGGGCRRH
jgi:hypothetical protein